MALVIIQLEQVQRYTLLSNGARIIEKHFTLDKNMYGPDHNLSANPEDLASIVKYRDDLKN